MTLEDNLTHKRSMPMALAATIAMHLGLVYLFLIMTARPHIIDESESRLTVHLIPLQALQKLVEQTLPKNEEPKREEIKRDRARPQRSELQPAASPQSASTPETPVQKSDAAAATSTPLTTDELISSLRRDIGRIDRELRKERPNLPGAKSGSSETRLARDIAKAGKITSGWLTAPTIEEIVLPDGAGKRVYKVSFPGGHYCVTYESVGRRDGYDLSRNFHGAKVTNCPGD